MSGVSRRVKTSTLMPRSPSRRANSATYTFRPPASPTPGVASGEVCMLTMATRCGYSTLARTFTSSERLQAALELRVESDRLPADKHQGGHCEREAGYLNATEPLVLDDQCQDYRCHRIERGYRRDDAEIFAMSGQQIEGIRRHVA